MLTRLDCMVGYGIGVPMGRKEGDDKGEGVAATVVTLVDTLAVGEVRQY